MNERLHVLLAQSGDRDAFDALLKSIQEPLYRYLVRVMSDHAAAEDTLQDVFLLIFRKLRWLSDPALFRPWAYRIATRAAFKRLKSDGVRASVVAFSTDSGDRPADSGSRGGSSESESQREHSSEPFSSTSRVESNNRSSNPIDLPELLEHVSPASRAVLALHYVEDMTLPEVAAVLSIPVGTAKSRLAYGLTQLRGVFNV